MKKFNRREFLKAIGGTSGFLFLNSNCAFNFPNSSFRTLLNVPSDRGLFGVLAPSSPFTMTAREIEHQIVPSKNTRLWVYEAEAEGKQYINPIIRTKIMFRIPIKSNIMKGALFSISRISNLVWFSNCFNLSRYVNFGEITVTFTSLKSCVKSVKSSIIPFFFFEPFIDVSTVNRNL